MSSDERSPKRQRLSSYSPASTPTETKSTPFVQHPTTPPPSVHMSPSWHSQSQSQPLPGLGMAGSGSAGGVNFPTPPSPAAGYHSQSVAQSVGSESESARQTPAAESERHDVEMGERGPTAGDGDGDVSMAEDGEHRRTDHERNEGAGALRPLPSAAGLHYLPTQPTARSNPHASQNILDLYKQQKVVASVARKDPVTGEKINKLRRSYEGKVKDLRLDGRNKASKNQWELYGLLEEPWDMITPDGLTYFEAQRAHVDFSERGAQGIAQMFDSALNFNPGRLPKAEDAKWKNALGLDDSKATPAAAGSAAPAKSPASHFLSKASPATAVQRSAPASPRGTGLGAARPERSGKKRRYDDASWEGYDEDGYSTGDGGSRRGSVSKRQKRKDYPASAATSPPPGGGGGGAGGSSSMVGVRSS